MSFRDFKSIQNLLCISLLCACTATDGSGSKDQGNDTGIGSDTGEEVVDTWRAKGNGYAYLLDGQDDHSLFRLEIQGTLVPRQGYSYYGWLMGGSDGYKLMGPIPVSVSEVEFEFELGVNGLLNGYRQFKVFQHDEVPLNPGVGDPVWAGEMSEESLILVQGLIGGSGAADVGSLRATETAVETIIEAAQDAIDNFTVLPDFNADAEAISNAVTGVEVDVDQNGQVSTIDGVEKGIVGENSHVEDIFTELGNAFDAFGGVEAEEHIRLAIGNAYDCVQRVESHALRAQSYAGVATVCASQGPCESTMRIVLEELGMSLVGEDLNDDGVVDQEDEGTIECGIDYISRLVGFPVSVAN
jgi:hypothetical protein